VKLPCIAMSHAPYFGNPSNSCSTIAPRPESSKSPVVPAVLAHRMSPVVPSINATCNDGLRHHGTPSVAAVMSTVIATSLATSTPDFLKPFILATTRASTSACVPLPSHELDPYARSLERPARLSEHLT
jgi:hypothetical protein